MFGSILGNITGVSYFLAFQILGILLSFLLFHKEKKGIAVLIGSTLGSFGIHWLPTLYAFLFNFTKTAHALALLTMAIIVFLAYATSQKRNILRSRDWKFSIKEIIRDNPVLFLLFPLFIFVVMILLHNTISVVDGSMLTGQNTFGDMNMHLGFITSIANQGVFPPEYSIHPGTPLAYPFLSDSISSSVYIWGTSLRVAYLLPMYFALLQVFFGMYTLGKYLLQQMGTSYRGKSFLAFVLFFFNGGFGFIYFINEGFFSENFTRIFTEFYQTPTNYTAEGNIQWHNIVCDMLIPQRATLFGWAMLFPILLLIFKALKNKDNTFFKVAGILAGGLPLIHTHSFLSLGILCAVFLAIHLYQRQEKDEKKRWPLWMRLIVVVVTFGILEGISRLQHGESAFLTTDSFLYLGALLILAFLGYLVYLLVKNYSKDLLSSWGSFLIIVLICALPQLFGFTFRQAQGEQFVRGVFNWVNMNEGTGLVRDTYFLFNIKNLGIMFLLAIILFVIGTKKQIRLVLPAAFMWLACEFIVFQPNTYDNNKIMLVSYLFFCIAIADFVWETIPGFFKKYVVPIRAVTVSLVTALGIFAAVLTMGREYVAEYELYNADYVSACRWIEQNTKPRDVFLTNTNHNNAVASLTGRNIVCGSSSFLFYHGIDYAAREADVRLMYSDAALRNELMAIYDVSYMVVGPYEYNNYPIDISSLTEYELVYQNGSVYIFKVD